VLEAKLKTTLYNAVKWLPVSEAEKGSLRLRLDKEIAIVEKNHLEKIFKKPKRDNLVTLQDVIADESNSIIGHLMHCLTYETKETTAIKDIKDFVVRLRENAKYGGGSLSEKQIKELIVHGLFGDPDKAWEEYWLFVHPQTEMPKETLSKISVINTRRSISLAEATELAGKKVNTLDDYINPASLGHNLHIVGWAKQKPKKIVYRETKKAAFFDIYSCDDTIRDETTIIECAVWDDEFETYQRVLEQIKRNSLLSVVGRRTCDKKRGDEGKRKLFLTGQRMRILQAPDE
jgi:hypothetical protein